MTLAQIIQTLNRFRTDPVWNLRLRVMGMMTAITVIVFPVQAQTVMVPPGTSIQNAINNAEPGTEILLEAGTYTEQLTINKDITITGHGQNHTIIQAAENPNSANGRVITIDDGNVHITGVTIRNGNQVSIQNGGGISNNGTLHITSSTISGNRVQVLSADGGGGIYNTGTLYITSSTISDNSVSSTMDGFIAVGGGILNENPGILYITSSTISSNEVTTVGSRSTATGGGIFNSSFLQVHSSTISGNQLSTHGNAAHAQGGGNFNSGTTQINSTTISSNQANASGTGNAMAAEFLISTTL